MKSKEKLKVKSGKTKEKGGVIKKKLKKEKVLVVAQEIKYARLLSGNEKKTRDRVLKALKKWLAACFQKNYDFKEEDFTRVWKGLFYAVWMSDKPLVQEELCDNIASILDEFPPEQLKYALLMTKAGFKTLANEWYGIDQHRIDKFLMLVRRYLRGSLRCLKRCDWSLASCQKYANMLSQGDGLFAVQTPHYARNATSMLLHIMDCYLEEIAKVSAGSIPDESLGALLHPFVLQLAEGQLYVRARQMITELLRQTDEGIMYDEKRKAWERMGCPEGGPDALQLVSDDEQSEDGGEEQEELNETVALDPRAGRVNVSLPCVAAPRSLLHSLRGILPRCKPAAHRRVKLCIQRLERVFRGECPLPVAPPCLSVGPRVKPRRVARALHALDNKLKNDADELKLRGLSRKHRKRLLKKTRAGISIVEELAATDTQTETRNNGEWQVGTIQDTQTDKTSNKENQNKRKSKDNSQQVKNKKQKLDKKIENNQQKVNSKKDNCVKDSSKKVSVKDKIKNKSVKDKIVKKDNLVKAKDSNNKQMNSDVKDSQKNKDNNKEKSIKLPNKDKKDASKDKIENIANKSNLTKVNLVKDNQQKGNSVKDNQQKDKLLKDKQEKDKLLKDNQQKDKSLKDNQQKDKLLKDNQQKDNTILNKATLKNVKITKENGPKFTAKKIKKFEKNDNKQIKFYETPKKVQFVLKNNSMQKPIDYYKSVRQSPSIPFDSSKKPTKTNLKPSTPSPINPFFKKKLKMNK